MKQPIVKKQWVWGRFICYELLAHANLTSPSACLRIYPFYRATFSFSFTFAFPLLFLFFFLSLFLFLFFASSLFFFLSIFLFFIFSASFPHLFIFGRPFRGREERNNK
jgi:hypothetical protein